LCDILSLVAGIPLPQGALPPPANEDEDLHLVVSSAFFVKEYFPVRIF